MLHRWFAFTADPRFMIKLFHKWAAWAWLVSFIPAYIWFRDSIPVLLFISIYANVVGHWSSHAAARTEAKQDEQET